MFKLFGMLFLNNEIRHKHNFVFVSSSLHFLKQMHFQNVHLLPQYAPDNDVEQSDTRLDCC